MGSKYSRPYHGPYVQLTPAEIDAVDGLIHGKAMPLEVQKALVAKIAAARTEDAALMRTPLK